MGRFKDAAEQGFVSFARLVLRHRIKTILAVLALVGGLATQLPSIVIDTSTEGFFHPEDPAKVAYEVFREQFGRDDMTLVAVQPPQVFDPGFLRKLKAFHQALEKGVPHLKEVNSLINARNTRGEGDQLIVKDLLEELPTTPEAMAALKKTVLDSPLYSNLFISGDGSVTTLVLETMAFSDEAEETDALAGFGVGQGQPKPGEAVINRAPLTNEQSAAVVAAVEKIAAEFEAPDFKVYIAGTPVWTAFLLKAMPKDMGRFIALAVVAIGIFLFLLFRRVSGVVVPLLGVVLSLVATIGLMAATGTNLTSPTSILPSFLLAVGIGASVHLLAIFYGRFAENHDKEASLVYALGHSGLPILMTGLTTAAGLFSFVTADLAPVAHLGLFGGIGAIISLVMTLVFLPALMGLWPLRKQPLGSGGGRGEKLSGILRGVAHFSTGHPGAITLVFLAGFLVAAVGLSRLEFSHQPIRWIPEQEKLRVSIDLVDQKLKGASTLEVVIDTGKENGLYDPAVLEKIDGLARFAEQYRDGSGQKIVGKTSSVVDVLRETNKALHGNDPQFYSIPKERELVAQELLLFENSGTEDLQRLVDSTFRTARLTIKVIEKSAGDYVDFVTKIEREGTRLFTGGETFTVTGLLKLFIGVFDKVISSMVKSYLIAFFAIAVMMMLLLGSFQLGLLSMIPNLLPIAITLGFMGWAGIPMDAFTLLIGGIALGLAVDDTIHFFHNVRGYYGKSGDMRQAVQETLLTSGRAMLIATVVLVIGFWLFMFASLNNVFYFGMLTGMALVIALAADFFLSPALLMLLLRGRYGRSLVAQWSGGEPDPTPQEPIPAD